MNPIKNLVNKIEAEIRDSAIELIELVVSKHMQYPSEIKTLDFKQQYNFALAAANRIQPNSLSDESKSMIYYLRQIKI